MVALGGAWDTTRYGDTINERAVRILLECILVNNSVWRPCLEFLRATFKVSDILSKHCESCAEVFQY